MVKILDATLREGVQAPGVRLGDSESVEIARALVRIGVDMVECGHPHIGETEAARVRAVVAACGSVPVLAHARARREDIDAVRATGARWVGVFAGVNAMSRLHRIRTDGPIAALAADAIRHAKKQYLRVRFTIEDASRTAWDELHDGFAAAVEAGADRLCFADTVGVLCPWEVEAIVGRLKAAFPGAELEVHFHDDRGLAEANALAAVRAGADWVSTSVNGMGERCGITDTLTLMANLDAMGERDLCEGHRLPEVSRMVQAFSRFAPDRRRPVVGRNAFTHVARLHRRAVTRDEAAYSWMDPGRLGRVTTAEAKRLPAARAGLVNRPEVICATELRHHRKGPGDRYLMLDERVVEDARQYCIVRHIPESTDPGPGHVDGHVHDVDSLFLFTGKADDLTGLQVEVDLGGEVFAVSSPASVFIPAGVHHSYRVTGGGGLFFNHVLAGDYNSSLLDLSGPVAAQKTLRTAALGVPANESEDGALGVLRLFIDDRLPGAVIERERAILDVFDSLMFLDFFLFLEADYGERVSLDDIAGCTTFGELIDQMTACIHGRPLAAVG